MDHKLQEIKCNNCGASLDVYTLSNRAICKYCGANYFIGIGISSDNNILSSISTASFTGNSLEKDSDSTTNIRIIRDDLDNSLEFNSYYICSDYGKIDKNELLHSLQFTRQIDENNTIIRYSRTPSFYELVEKLLFISAVSFYLKKSYRIKNYITNGYLFDNFVPDKESMSNLMSRNGKYACEFYKRRISEFTTSRSQYINEFKNDLAKFEFELKEKIETVGKVYLLNYKYKSFWDSTSYSADIKGNCDIHFYSYVFPIIYPEYYKEHFIDIYSSVEDIKIKNGKALEEISTKINEYIDETKKKTGELIFKLSLTGEYIKWGLIETASYEKYNKKGEILKNHFSLSSKYEDSGFPYSPLYIYFNQLGMNCIPNGKIEIQVCLAIISCILEKAQIDGKNMLDLLECPFIDNYDNSVYNRKYILDNSKPIELKYVFKYLERKEKIYNDWI